HPASPPLVRQPRETAVVVPRLSLAGRARSAAEEAPRAVSAPLALASEDDAVAEPSIDPTQTEAAAPGPRAARVLDQLVALDQQRILLLERFDRQVRRVGHVNLHGIGSILVRPPAPAPA